MCSNWEHVKDENADVVVIWPLLRPRLRNWKVPEDRSVFLEGVRIGRIGSKQAFESLVPFLDLITYFTAGEKEVRAWTIKKGWSAPQAAGVIHTDFEKVLLELK